MIWISYSSPMVTSTKCIFTYVVVFYELISVSKLSTGRTHGSGSPRYRESLSPPLKSSFFHTPSSIDSIRSTTHRCSFPIFPLPNALRSQVHPLRKRSPPRPQARQSARQRGLRTQNLRFRTGKGIHARWRAIQICRKSRLHDRVCRNPMVQSS